MSKKCAAGTIGLEWLSEKLPWRDFEALGRHVVMRETEARVEGVKRAQGVLKENAHWFTSSTEYLECKELMDGLVAGVEVRNTVRKEKMR